MSHYDEFNRVIVNDAFEKAVGELLQILRGKPGYEARRPELKPLLADLLG
jgi:guanylate kinase